MFLHHKKVLVVAAAALALACGPQGVVPGASSEGAPQKAQKKQAVGGTIHTDTFTQGALVGGYADILFVVDSSCSMADDQQRLANSFSTFINWISQENVDFHIAITTMDMGTYGEKGAFVGVPSVLDNNTPNLVSTFQANVNVGEMGSGIEEGFAAAQAALAEPLLSTVNAGFLRDNAKLYVVFVTDEDDQSPATVQDLISTLTALKADPGQVHFSAIAVDQNTTCDALSSTPTQKYLDLLAATSGLFGSICDADFGVTLQQLAFEVTSASGEYFLTRVPAPETIEVTVDGALQPAANWVYHPATNSVELLAAYIPQPGASIVITYEIAGTGSACLGNGEVVYDLDGGEYSWKFYCVEVPAGTGKLLVHLWSGRGDADLYMKKGARPAGNDYDHLSIIEEQDETLLLELPAEGTWWIGVYGFHRYDDVNLQPIWIETQGGGSAGPGHLVLSGVFYDTPGTDSDEEYVELYNPTQASVSLDGWAVSDNGGTFAFPAGTTLAPGAYLVVARDAAGHQALFGAAPSLDGLNLNLGNTGDWLMLQDPSGATVDFVAWENAAQGWTLGASTGAALARTDPGLDSDGETDWSVVSPATPRS